ncbi:hypothetical protein LO749_20935 [Paracoccus denitrificans]|uniref:DNA-directed RNA polymerase n=1 Tax=Paracoccus denitrificans TaxID=266 RepID=UPI001E403D93|nr:DNA-directed RNA polymerase [Paracoccus denitrificans]UFS66961.1 hypothetical protein LO749_20935 [Paracoccus denitrificans]
MPTLLRVQEKLEKDMVSRGRARFEDIRRRAEASDDALRSRTYRVVLEAALEPLSEAVGDFIVESTSRKVGRRVRSAQFMAPLDPSALAYITLSLVVSATTGGPVPLVRSAERVGRAVEVEAHFAHLEETAPGLAFAQKKILDGSSTTSHRQIVAKFFTGSAERKGEKERWAASDRIAVGIKLIELLIVSTGLFRIHRQRVKNKTTDMVCPSGAYREWVEGISDKLAGMFPAWMPMVVPPKDWSGLDEGGYLTDSIPFPPSLVKTGSKGHRNALKGADLSRVMAAVNALQRTPWRVHKGVLGVAEELIRQGRPVAGLPDMDPEPLPTAPMDFSADPRATKRWKQAAAAVYERNAKALHKRLIALNAVSMAREFSGFERIYFPHQCDFRGRVYPIPTQLSPQGTDLQRGLLTFSEGAPLGSLEGARWFEAHGANCFGIDKVPFSERQAWVSRNAGKILSSARQPLDFSWWMDADSPFQFLAWCFEYAEWQVSGFDLGYVSRIPVAMDGSCNGIQHYSAMLRDPRGGAATNLTPSDHPQDLYGEVAEVVREKLWKIYSDKLVGTQEERLARVWLDHGIDRSLCKPAVIGFSFGGTREGAYTSILKHVEGQPHPPTTYEDLAPACRFLSGIVWEAVQEVARGAGVAMGWLKEVARASKGALTWTTPSGFVVRQDVRKSAQKRVNVTMFGLGLKPAIRQETEEIDSRRQVSSFPPNFCHSLDAAHLVLTVNASVARGLHQFAMIHDSFGCPAGQAPVLAEVLREEFIRIYEGDPLRDLYRDLGGDPSSPLNSPPVIGGLCLTDIRKSDYFFA